MRAIELIADVDSSRRLTVSVPASILPGKVRVIVLTPEQDEDETGRAWAKGLAHEWSEELSDVQQDIYTLDDGQSVHAAR